MNSCTLVSIAKHAYRGAYACMSPAAHALNEREGVGGWGRITGETRMYRDANVLSLMACFVYIVMSQTQRGEGWIRVSGRKADPGFALIISRWNVL